MKHKWITVKVLERMNACSEGVEAFKGKYKRVNVVDLIQDNLKGSREELEWLNWLIVRCMTYKQYVSYAVYAAEQVIAIYEKKYPNDKRPRKAIDAAKKCIKNPTAKNKKAAYAAAYAAADAAADADAYGAAAYAADAAAVAAAYAAADAAAAAAYAAKACGEPRLKIAQYAIKVIGLDKDDK